MSIENWSAGTALGLLLISIYRSIAIPFNAFTVTFGLKTLKTTKKKRARHLLEDGADLGAVASQHLEAQLPEAVRQRRQVDVGREAGEQGVADDGRRRQVRRPRRPVAGVGAERRRQTRLHVAGDVLEPARPEKKKHFEKPRDLRPGRKRANYRIWK